MLFFFFDGVQLFYTINIKFHLERRFQHKLNSTMIISLSNFHQKKYTLALDEIELVLPRSGKI